MVGKKSLKTDAGTDLRLELHVAAYERWQSRGMPPGTALEDWLAVEAEILAAKAPKRKAPAAKKKA